MRRICWVCGLVLLGALALVGCTATSQPGPARRGARPAQRTPGTPPPAGAPAPGEGPGHGPGMGRGPGMGPRAHGGPEHGMGRGRHWGRFHRLPVPEPYASLANPMPGDPESIARGETIYQTYCASCHGEKALAEAEAGQKLDPPAPPLARTVHGVNDPYLFWRISEGGAELGTAMPAYKDVLSEQDIWDVINYLRDLSDRMMPGMMPGGGHP